MKTTPPRSLWPLSIAAFFAVAILGIALFIGWAVRQDMDLVREDYYAEEIRFQQQMERVRRTGELRRTATIAYAADAQMLRVALPAPRATGWIHFYRPSDAALDKNVKLSLNADGEQHVSVADFRGCLWKVRVHWQADGEEFYADESIVLKTKDS